jgi:hypothetical protein
MDINDIKSTGMMPINADNGVVMYDANDSLGIQCVPDYITAQSSCDNPEIVAAIFKDVPIPTVFVLLWENPLNFWGPSDIERGVELIIQNILRIRHWESLKEKYVNNKE